MTTFKSNIIYNEGNNVWAMA